MLRIRSLSQGSRSGRGPRSVDELGIKIVGDVGVGEQLLDDSNAAFK